MIRRVEVPAVPAVGEVDMQLEERPGSPTDHGRLACAGPAHEASTLDHPAAGRDRAGRGRLRSLAATRPPGDGCALRLDSMRVAGDDPQPGRERLEPAVAAHDV